MGEWVNEPNRENESNQTMGIELSLQASFDQSLDPRSQGSIGTLELLSLFQCLKGIIKQLLYVFFFLLGFSIVS